MIKPLYIASETDTAYGRVDGVFMQVATNWSTFTDAEKISAFQRVESDTATVTELTVLGKFRVVTYIEGDSVVGIARPIANGTGDWTMVEDDGMGTYQPTCTITAVPKPQIILPKGLMPLYGVSAIQSVKVNSKISTASKVCVAVTKDLETYKTYSFDENAWVDLDVTDTDVFIESGIAVENLPDVPKAAWAEFGLGGLAFAYCIKQTTLTGYAEVQSISLTVELIGRWDKAINGTDYRYGYIDHNGISINVTFLQDGSFKVNYTNADADREVESFQEPFGLGLTEGETDDAVLVDSRGDTL